MVPSASAMAARSGSRVGAPTLEQRRGRFLATGNRQRGEPASRGADQFLITGIRNPELQRLQQVPLMRRAVAADQADRRRDRRLQGAGRRALEIGEHGEAALVADPADRQDRVVLEWPFELGDVGDRLERVGAAILTQRLDDHGAEQILPAHDQRAHRLADFGIAAVRRKRPCHRGTNELGFLLVHRRQQTWNRAGIRVMLEPRVRDRAQPIVLVLEHPQHGVAGAGIVEAGQQDERPEAHVPVRRGLVAVSVSTGTAIAGSARRTVRDASMRTGNSKEPRRPTAAFSCSGVTLPAGAGAGAGFACAARL